MNYQNKTIGIWGYGRVGKAATQFLLNQGASVVVYDDKMVELPPSVHRAQSIDELFQTPYLLPSPGVDTRPYRQRYQGVWLSELDIFQHHFHKKIIAVTGSVGKTTVTHLLTQLLATAGWRVKAIGNIGIACLDIIAEQQELDAVVIEVSSFQLEYAQCFAPDLAIITNLHPNHLDRHASLNDYAQAKCTMLRHQQHGQHALLAYDILPHLPLHALQSTLSFFCRDLIKTDYPLFYIDQETIMYADQTVTTPLMPLHALDKAVFPLNWLVAYAAINVLRVTPCALPHIEPIAHRLERVATQDSITFYNDSKSTTPASTLAALEALRAPRILLFLGGLSKGIDRTPLIQALQKKPIQVICFGKEAPVLHENCASLGVPSHMFLNLSDAFSYCTHIMQPRDTILFSPAGSSFDLFENYEKRGEEFKALVLQYCQTRDIS